MKRFLILTAAAAMLAAWGWSREASAGQGMLKGRVAYRQPQTYSSYSPYPWHGEYYDAGWGTPVAVLVPPTARTQTHWNWGVGGTRVTPIQHQFQSDYPGPALDIGAGFRPTPRWPSSTDQFGDYYIRGPW